MSAGLSLLRCSSSFMRVLLLLLLVVGSVLFLLVLSSACWAKGVGEATACLLNRAPGIREKNSKPMGLLAWCCNSVGGWDEG